MVVRNALQRKAPAAINWPLLYTTVAISTAAALLLELSLTRIFSVVFYYHFAFLAISIALFGMGVGGLLSYLTGSIRGSIFRKLGVTSLANSVLVVFALLFILTRGATVTNLDFTVIYVACALPFLGTGMIVSLAINETVDRIDKVYFADLTGAAAGCFLLVVFLNTFGGPNTVIAVSVLFAAAGAMWFSLAGFKFGRVASVGVGLFFALIIIANLKSSFLEVRYGKGQKLKEEQFHKWNSISRVGLAGNMIYIDADASTGIANFDFNHLSAGDLKALLHQGPGTPYILRPGAKTLIIGPGGGWDVSRALASGSHNVTAVEINPIIANTIMRKQFPQLSNRLYFRPDVHLNVEDGRAFVRRSTDKFQVIQATLVDTWASTAAGAFALSENNLYTTDAFRDYFSHLTSDGLLTFTRWGFNPPRESLRLLSLAIVALSDLGEHDPASHVIVGRSGAVTDIGGWGAQDTVIFSRKPLSDADVARARDAFATAGMEPVYLPGDIPHNPFGELLTSADPAAYERNYPFDISPVSDDRPFFFYTVQPRDVPAYLLATAGKAADVKTNIALPKLIQAMFISIAAIIVILILPPLVLGTRLPKDAAVRWFLPYFLAIGVGYILIEVALIQKFVLFLGHPTYALTVVIFSLLIASGAGSFFSRKLVGRHRSRLVTVLGVAFALVAILAAVVPPLLTAGVGLPLFVKVLLTVVLLAPAGFAMGMPFPSALRMLDRHHGSAVRWAWSLNAAASVAGSVGALVLGLYLGLMQTLLLGGALYLVALALAAASSVCATES
jgi:hypothetical protein